MLKAKISQTKSNLYAVKTTKYDTTDIELIVETTDSSPWLNPKFELLGIKSDGHEVRQTENFKVIDLNNHIVQVTLDEQLVTCEGNVDLQLLIKDGSRKSSTPFKLFVGRSLDSEILESHRNVKVLDELEKYIIEGREYISEATELAQSTANYVQAVNTQAEANEAQRLQNESQRQSAETKRKEAEDERKQAEVLRVQNEDTRQSAEAIRITNEQTRLENESNRIERETTRENKESIRQVQEQKRHNAESTRQSQEATRQSNEDNRKQAEKSRNQEETTRINNETTRERAEDTRKSQELDRQSAESARQTSETNRNNAESTRTQNENTRQSQETSRVTNEQARVRQEQERVNNENTRKTEEAKRVEAEELRKEAYTEATQLLEELRNFEPITENDRTDYMGNVHQTLKAKNDADVDWLLGEINTVHYDGQHITATDTIEGRSKSTILKGNTESIIDRFENGSYNNNFEKVRSDDTRIRIINPITNITNFSITLNDGFQILCLIKKNDGTVSSSSWSANANLTLKITDQLVFVIKKRDNSSIICEEVIQAVNSTSYKNLTELKSVKMPVLTTTGKNAFNINAYTSLRNNTTIEGEWLIFWENYQSNESKWDVTLAPNTSYYVSDFIDSDITTNNSSGRFRVVDKMGNEILKLGGFNRLLTTTNESDYVFEIGRGSGFVGSITKFKIQIEQGTVATSYEPFKSNILTTPQDLELRGIGDVQDTLDCLTGEVTERIGEIVFDGSENWVRRTTEDSKDGFEDTICFYYRTTNMTEEYGLGPQVLCDKFNYVGMGYNKTNESISSYKDVRYGNRDIFIRIKRERLETEDLDGFKKWLKTNILTVQYPIEKVVKTVDLSDNHVYSYKDATHYDCSSAEGSLVPTLSIDVPTNLPAVVTRQRETIVEQKNQIKLLEETNSELIISQETQDEEIVTNMLASAELFEMVLLMMPMSVSMSKSMEVNPMVEVYVTLILKGEKTIEQVPAVIRDKVQAQLDLLTK